MMPHDDLLMRSDVCGILQPVIAIQSGIQESHLYQHVSGAPKPVKVNIVQIWNERKLDTSAKNEALILYFENEVQSAMVRLF